MEGVIMLFILFVVIVTIGAIKAQKENDEMKEVTNKNKGVIFSITAKYIAGIPNRTGGVLCDFNVLNDRLELAVNLKTSGMENAFQQEFINIYKPQIKDIRIISKEYLSEKVSLGKVVLIGLPLAMLSKNKKQEVVNYLEITYMDEYDIERNLVFSKVEGLENMTTTLRKLLLIKKTV